ncbi:MAG: sigma-70 family RNA polymerase sigma factor [Flavobacteriaceae bacterium]|nr:sigma-70 family RNA polymerase sigma factor [Flavobacteriaceae bacterium]
MDDRELIDKTLQGNTHAFTFLVRKHQKLVVHMVARLLDNKEDIEDVCQDVFVKVFRNLNKFRNDSKLSTWIAKIAYRVAIDYLSRKNRQIITESDEILSFTEPETSADLPDTILENKELKNIMVTEIEKLPLPYRTIITLYHLEEFSYKEIEEITGIKIGTIKSHLSRGRAILKEKLTFALTQQRYEK